MGIAVHRTAMTAIQVNKQSQVVEVTQATAGLFFGGRSSAADLEQRR
ncbi:hypothetical protein L917_18520 [Phytophthora nicotianae]|uniref:Uncharacterized protein n=1 Tax=Phytophthora nicotianae TaxID=4792 RepID=W2K7I6_PHYNI|nr:hypothetical protein L917_18520 [Phytophthora nicotianae]